MGQNFSSEPVVEKDTERDRNETFEVAVSSCQGWRTSQEDNHTMMLELPGNHKAAFFAVYDGHGGARVSRHASESLWRHLTQNEHYEKGDFRLALEQSFLTFDREVEESYNAQLAGTTAVCILIANDTVYCANIGDSRAVASLDCECYSLSHDHKPENPDELERIILAGGYVLGNRVNGNLALSRAFGDFHYKGNGDLPPEKQVVSSFPDITSIPLKDNVDFIVLACDGIWDVLTSMEVVDFVISRLERGMEPSLICEQLTTRCLASDYELVVGCDNMTVLLVCHTRGRSWDDYCNDIFEKNNKRLGILREKTALDSLDLDKNTSSTTTTTTTSTTNTTTVQQETINDILELMRSRADEPKVTSEVVSQEKDDSTRDKNTTNTVIDPSSSPSSSSTTSTATTSSDTTTDINNKTTTNPTEGTIEPKENFNDDASLDDEKTTQEKANPSLDEQLASQCNIKSEDEKKKNEAKAIVGTESKEAIQTSAYEFSDINRSEEELDKQMQQNGGHQSKEEVPEKESPTTDGNKNECEQPVAQ